MTVDIRSLADALQNISVGNNPFRDPEGIPLVPLQSMSNCSVEVDVVMHHKPTLKRTETQLRTPYIDIPARASVRRTPPPAPPSRDDIGRFCTRSSFAPKDTAEVRCLLEKMRPSHRPRFIAGAERLRRRLSNPVAHAAALRVLAQVPEYQFDGLMAHVLEVFDRAPSGDIARLSMLASLVGTATLERTEIMKLLRCGLMHNAGSAEFDDVLHRLTITPQLELESLSIMCEALGGADAASDMRLLCTLPADARTEAFAMLRARAEQQRLIKRGVAALEKLVTLAVEPHLVLHRTQSFINSPHVHPASVQAKIDRRDVDGHTLRQHANVCVRKLHAVSKKAGGDTDGKETARVFALAWFAAESHPDSYNVRLALMTLLGDPPDSEASDICNILMILSAPYPQLGVQRLAMLFAA